MSRCWFIIMKKMRDEGSPPRKGTPAGDTARFARYKAGGGQMDYAEWLTHSRGGRSGGPIHKAIQKSLKDRKMLIEEPFGTVLPTLLQRRRNPPDWETESSGRSDCAERDAILDIIRSPEYEGDNYLLGQDELRRCAFKGLRGCRFVLPNWGER